MLPDLNLEEVCDDYDLAWLLQNCAAPSGAS
jgi:hypothetical protein